MAKNRKRIKPLKTKPVYAPGEAEALGILSVNRVEALARVLNTAIWLWVLEKDPLSIHLLVMSQYNCIQDLARHTVKGPFSAMFTDAAQRNLVYDFLRHSTRNPQAGVDFMPSSNGLLLYDVICSFEDLFGRATPYMKAFIAFFLRGLAQDDPGVRKAADQELPKGFTAADFIGLSRRACFDKLAKAFSEEAV